MDSGLVANRNIGQKKIVFLKNKYISVILAFVVCSLKLVTSAVGISLPLIFFILFLSMRNKFALSHYFDS